MRNRTPTIDDWHPIKQFRVKDSARHTNRWSPKFVGIIGTLLVHVLVFQSAILGTRAHKIKRPETVGPGATFIKSEVTPSETLVLIDLPKASMIDPLRVDELASVRSTPKSLVTLLSNNPVPRMNIPKEALSDDKEAAAVDSGDPSVRAAMFGRYTGQIDARIERAWRRPRSPVNSSSGNPWQTGKSEESAIDDFKCQIRIIQDAHGNVQEIQLRSCNGSVIWQQSLTTAIRSSSPLPAPPISAVFTNSLTMTFTAAPYTSASAADDYELRTLLLGHD